MECWVLGRFCTNHLKHRWEFRETMNECMTHAPDTGVPIQLGLITRPGGCFKNTYEFLNLRALKFSTVNEIHIFQCMGKIFCVEFQRYPLKLHTKYLPIQWKIWFSYNIEILRVLRFKSSYVFLKRPPEHQQPNALPLDQWAPCVNQGITLWLRFIIQ